MDLQNLKNKHPLLISYMEVKKYGKQYIKFIKKEINWILNNSEHYKWKSYGDIYQTYAHEWKNNFTIANKRRGLLLIKRFDLESKMPDGLKHYHKPSNYNFLNDEFKHFIDTYRSIVKSKEAKSYYKSIEYSACSFLLELQKSSIDSLDSITEKSVLDVFNKNNQICKSHTVKCYVTIAFKICIPFYDRKLCLKILSYLPNIQRIRKNIQYLTTDEVNRIKSVLEDDFSISLQNKAICILALYTGLRSSDISGLTFDEIDWKNDLIHIKQRKTGSPLVLPLRAIVGNAIFDYITKERYESSDNSIFLTVNAPYRRLHTTNLNAICVTIMNKAGIRNNPGDRRGFHLFRHYLATSLLENGIAQPIISSTLGHQSPESLNPYLSADFSHLKKCALSIESFPVKKEIFQS